MKKLEFTIDINAPAEKVWYSLWDEENYKNWTNAFCEGSYVVTDYKEGSKAHFLSPSGEGMFSSVSINKPFEIMSFNHIGILKNFEEQPIDDETVRRTFFSVERRCAETGNHISHWRRMLWMDGIQSKCFAQPLPSPVPCV